MRKIIYLALIAITVLASCNSKEKEDKAYARVSISNDPAEMKAYLDQYFEEAPPEHLVKIRKNLRVWTEDSTAFANINGTKDLATKISLETDYISKFKEGKHRTEINDMLVKDKKAFEVQKIKEEKLARYNMFKENVVDYIFAKETSVLGLSFIRAFIFGAPDENGNGKGAYVSNIEDEKDEKFTYKLADNGDLLLKIYGGNLSINFMNNGFYVKDDYYQRQYSPELYKKYRKYFK